MVKILICGSRAYPFKDEPKIIQVLDTLLNEHKESLEIISGMARGPDKIAADWALNNRVCLHKFPVTSKDWETYGKAAGMLRNSEMLAIADEVIAFWDGISNGTKDTINKAKKLQLPCKIYFSES